MSPWLWILWTIVAVVVLFVGSAVVAGTMDAIRVDRLERKAKAREDRITALIEDAPPSEVHQCAGCPKRGTEDEMIQLTDEKQGVTAHYCGSCWMGLFGASMN